MVDLLLALLASTLDYAPALIFAALGTTLGERAGIVSLHMEGTMRTGAFVAAVAALAMPTPLGIVCGMAAGAAVGLIHAFLCLTLRADQVVSGMALNVVALALFTFLLEALYSPSGTPSIAQLPRLGSGAMLGHSVLTYLALLLPILAHWGLSRTVIGLRIRAVGEHPEAAATVGVRVGWLRLGCLVAGGALGGLGGAALSTTTLDRFEQHMPAGLGYMAVAATVFGRWTPLGALGAALFFAAGNALRISLASSAPWLMAHVPNGVMFAFPYLLTLVVLVLQRRSSAAPAALGHSV